MAVGDTTYNILRLRKYNRDRGGSRAVCGNRSDALKSAGNWSETQIEFCNTEFWDLYWRRKPKTGFWITGAFGESLFLKSCLSSTRDSDSGAVGLEVFLQKAWSQQRVVRIHSWIAEWFSNRWSYRSSCYYGCTSGFTKSAECETRFR